jgi:hypothetical protein
MMETGRATTSAVPPTADIVAHRGHVRKVPISEVPDATLWRRQKQRNYSRVSFRTWGPMTRYRRVKFLNASARRSNCFPVRPIGVAIRRQGTKAPVKTLETRDRRSPLTTWRMSRIAKGSYCRARCSQKQALAQIAKSGGLRFRLELRAWQAGGVGANAGAFLPERGFVMRNRIDIDPKHSRAIVQEIGERLRAVLKEEPECPGSLRTQIDRLRELEEQSPSIVPAAERWDKRRR